MTYIHICLVGPKRLRKDTLEINIVWVVGISLGGWEFTVYPFVPLERSMYLSYYSKTERAIFLPLFPQPMDIYFKFSTLKYDIYPQLSRHTSRSKINLFMTDQILI